MAVRDFIAERRFLVIGDRRFIVRRPTVGAVLLTLQWFGREILAVRTVSQATPEIFVHQRWTKIFPSVVRNEDLRWYPILSLIVDEVPIPTDQPWPVRELVREALNLVDLPKILEVLDLDVDPNADTDPTDRTSAIERDIVDFAREFKTSPHEVMNWPFESYIRTVAVIRQLNQSDELTINLADTNMVPSWLSVDDGRVS